MQDCNYSNQRFTQQEEAAVNSLGVRVFSPDYLERAEMTLNPRRVITWAPARGTPDWTACPPNTQLPTRPPSPSNRASRAALFTQIPQGANTKVKMWLVT